MLEREILTTRLG